jgi:hypothetical protein
MKDRVENRGFTFRNYLLHKTTPSFGLQAHKGYREIKVLLKARLCGGVPRDVSAMVYLWKLFIGCTGG